VSRPQPDARLTYPEYVAAEARSEVRHEFLDGCAYAMAGGTPEHAALAAAFGREIGNALRGKPCRVFSADLRVRVSATGLTTYPDLSVVCGKLETAADDPHAVLNPLVLVEVLSESSEAYDRGAKAAHYRRIASLAEYVLVSQNEPLIEVHRRNERGHFELIEARAGEHAELASLGVSISVDAVYENPLAGAAGTG
jgi:Uma2 family endonuclease